MGPIASFQSHSPALPPTAPHPGQCHVSPRAQASSLSLPGPSSVFSRLLLLTNPYMPGPNQMFSPPGIFPSILCLGVSSARLHPVSSTFCLEMSCLPHHSNSSFKAGTMLLFPSYPAPSQELHPQVMGQQEADILPLKKHTERWEDLQFPPRHPSPGAGQQCNEEIAASSPSQNS